MTDLPSQMRVKQVASDSESQRIKLRYMPEIRCFQTPARRKPGPKPRRVPQNSVPVPASPSPSLAQLFAAADSPQRPSSGSEESESASTTHHKDGRPRNLGRGVSKPKKNTVASLLAQSRALGIKPTPTLDPSVPLSHQVSLLRSNILAAQLHASATGQTDDKSQVKFVARRNEFMYRK